MKKICVMSGKNFGYMCKALRDFVATQLNHRPNTDRLDIRVNKDKMTVTAYANNNYSLGSYAASCLELNAEKDMQFFIRIPPIMPDNSEVVSILTDENPTTPTILVEYQNAGIMFRTTNKDNSIPLDCESYLANILSKPSAIVAFNAQYMKKALQALINSDDMVRRSQKPVFLSISGDVDPIRVFSEDGNQRIVLPTRNAKYPGKINLNAMNKLQTPEEPIKVKGVCTCPSCNHELRFMESSMTAKKDIKVCPYCGKALDLGE